MSGNRELLAALLAAWRADIDSVPAPAMSALDAHLALSVAARRGRNSYRAARMKYSCGKSGEI